MKKTLFLAAALLCLPGLVAGQARYRKKVDKHDDYHFLYASFGVGYSSLTAPQTMGTIRGDYGALVGAGYEFRHGGFWLSVGGQVSEQNSRLELEPYKYGAFDPTDGPIVKGMYNGEQVRLQYEIRQTDVNRWHSGDIPIMMGYYLHGFYIGAGVKTGFAFRNTTASTGEYLMNYQFERFIGTPLFDQSNDRYPILSKHSVDFRTQISIIGEVGYDILSLIPTRSYYCHVLKVGFYWEVGVRNIQKNDITYVNRLEWPSPETDCTKMIVNPYITSKLPDESRGKEFVAPFLTGVKITYMFGGSRTGSRGTLHKGCQCYNN